MAGTAASGSKICPRMSLHHDAKNLAMTWYRVASHTPFPSLRMTCYRFDGSFVSLALEIPIKQSRMARPGHELAVSFGARASRPIALNTRLNLSVDDVIHSQASHRILHSARHEVVFQLNHLDLRAETTGAAWCDLMLRSPEMVEVDLYDVVLTLRDRDTHPEGSNV